MIRTIEVAPGPAGWTVRAGDLAEETYFAGGAAAEASALKLAQRLSDAGEAVRLIVRLRDGSVGGRFLFPPHWPPEAEALESEAA